MQFFPKKKNKLYEDEMSLQKWNCHCVLCSVSMMTLFGFFLKN